MIPADLTKNDADQLLELDAVKNLVQGRTIVKVVFVPGRLLNIVVK